MPVELVMPRIHWGGEDVKTIETTLAELPGARAPCRSSSGAASVATGSATSSCGGSPRETTRPSL